MTAPVQFQDLQVAPETMIPHSREAEDSVIGAILINPQSFHECRLQLPDGAGEFYIHSHRFVWRAFERLVTAGTPIDFLTVSDALDEDGSLAEVGGAAFLMRLINQVPTSMHAAAYAEIVHKKYLRRQMLAAANKTATLAYDETKSIDEIAGEANRALMKAINLNAKKNSMSIEEALSIVDKQIDANGQQEEAPGIPTPWADYNKLLGGGWKNATVSLVIARPGKGKTSFLLQAASHAAKTSHAAKNGEGMRVKRNAVAIFSLEMPIEQLVMRLITQLSGIDYQTIEAGKFNDVQYPRYLQAVEALADLEINLDYCPAASPSYIYAKCELLAAQGKLDIVFVDSLNLMKSGGNYRGREFAEADECAQGLVKIAGDFNVPLIAAHQMNRDIERRGEDSRPTLADMRDGGEQPVHNAMFIWHQMDGERISRSWFVQAKHRNGPTKDVPITFLPQFTRFENYTSGAR